MEAILTTRLGLDLGFSNQFRLSSGADRNTSLGSKLVEVVRKHLKLILLIETFSLDEHGKQPGTHVFTARSHHGLLFQLRR